MRVVLVHGSVATGPATWPSVEPLRERFEVLLPSRSGYPPGPLLDHIDFEQQAEELAPLLEDGAHLVGHSYGGVISLFIAANHPEAVRSLAVSEPPAFALVRGNREVDTFVAASKRLWAADLEPELFLRNFLRTVGSPFEPPSPLPADVEAATRATQAERGPWEAEPPLDELAATAFPKLVISGAHHAAFDAVCGMPENRLGAERAVLPGAGHGISRAPGYNELLS